jgi:hypothetical protein
MVYHKVHEIVYITYHSLQCYALKVTNLCRLSKQFNYNFMISDGIQVDDERVVWLAIYQTL